MDKENEEYVKAHLNWDDFKSPMKTTVEQLDELDVRSICDYLSCGYSDYEIEYSINISQHLICAIRVKSIFAEISDEFEYPIVVPRKDVIANLERYILEAVSEMDVPLDPDHLSSVFGLSKQEVVSVLQEYPELFSIEQNMELRS